MLRQKYLSRINGFVLAAVFVFGAQASNLSAQEYGDVEPAGPVNVASTAWRISEVVLEQHIDPPSRQQLLLQATKAIYRGSGRQVPNDLSRKFSIAVDQDDIAKLVIEAFQEVGESESQQLAAENSFFEGLLHAIPGPVTRLTGKEYQVNESLRENRYVGIGIQLAMVDNLPQIVKPFPGGPARLSGARRMDFITNIDGTSTAGMSLGEVVDRLRGPKGTSLTVELRFEDEAPRTVDMVRDQIPIASVEGFQQDEDDDSWQYIVDDSANVGYIRLASITGSTAQEIREVARRLKSINAQRVVLDLRGLYGGDMHHVVLVADALLSGGTIGHIESRTGVQTFEAREEAILVGMPMVVLTDARSGPATEWLAAALQDNKRAEVVGVRTRTNGFVFGEFPLDVNGGGESEGVLGRLAVGWYLRGNGERLTSFFVPGSSTYLQEPVPIRNNNTPHFATEAGVVPKVHAFDSPSTIPDEALLEAIGVVKEIS